MNRKILRCFSRVSALLLAAVLLLSACNILPQQKILGKWMDSTGKQGYEFMEEGRVKAIFFQMKLSESGFLSSLASLIGIGSNFLDGNYDGSYTMDAKEKTVTITYTIFKHTETVTYDYAFEGSSLVLTDRSSGERVAYFLQQETTETQ